MILTLIVFLAVLSLLVLVHELGHFLMAKKAGIRIEEFGLGLPPRILGANYKGTIYSINWLPIGGFVKLYGEDEEEVPSTIGHKPSTRDAFFAKPKRVRATVLLAGVFMNTVLAAVVFYLFFFISNFKTEIPLIFDHQFFAVNQTKKTDLIIGQVSPNSPAEKAKIKKQSKVINVNGQTMENSVEFTKFINDHSGQEISLKLEDLNKAVVYEVKVVPRVNPPKNEGRLGIAFGTFQTAVLTYDTTSQKLFSGLTYSLNLLSYNLEVIVKLVGISFEEKTAAPVGEAVSGPIGLLGVFNQLLQIQVLKEKLLQGLNLVGLISISLAFFNVLPFPALDGGRLLFIALEALTKKRVNPKWEMWVHQIGLVILLGLVVLVTINDVLRVFRR